MFAPAGAANPRLEFAVKQEHEPDRQPYTEGDRRDDEVEEVVYSRLAKRLDRIAETALQLFTFSSHSHVPF